MPNQYTPEKRHFQWQGKRWTAFELYVKYDMSHSMFWHRIHSGWSLHKTLTTPALKNRDRKLDWVKDKARRERGRHGIVSDLWNSIMRLNWGNMEDVQP